VLDLKGITVSFMDAAGLPFIALASLDVAFAPGRLCAITGASGAGKSTLLHVISGLLPPRSGGVHFGAACISAMSEARRDRWRLANIGYIFQDFQLIPELTPVANVELPGSFGRNSIPKSRAAQLLDDFGVPQSRRRTAELSRGEQQRVAFARALYFDPPIILADEPTASLDAANAERVIARMRSLARDGKTVIVATHDRDLIAAAHDVLKLNHGELKVAAIA
jgi:putative ABC transport system ATP-binding protein